VIVGGLGAKRTPALAATYATEYNASFVDEPSLQAAFGRMDAALDAVGRDRGDLVRSIAQPVAVGRTEAEFRSRAERLQRDPEELRRVHLGGTVAEVADRISRYESMGAGRVYLQVLDMTDLDHLAVLADGLL
jgi:alkanesulfonate monooxygenase SsuD/methylene tetrahydromethanopterin reductase-like flavin-dependent oxidoreductase (luciferase family)